ncbi:DNA-binding GntR family transcriptional regulator [Azospirillum agricola]|uniref:GntR family transcriptional regulator n=1 Tax=Azospirillum agricola TaxID=1720247 RepID=UPI001F4697F9|nr:GntR family transcriptional regulator [Azospirillum agricola]MBP2231117.1 DNA-binding GntR family transcriptional regulator [Azospirillum agricola]
MSVDDEAPDAGSIPRRRRAPPPSLAEMAVDRLRGMIIYGDLAPSARLIEPELSERLGISRTPLREALKLLAAEGLVMLRPNRNAIVAPLDAAELTHLFEAEGCIESFAARLAAERMTAADLRRLRGFQGRIEALQGAGALEEYFDINQKIHRLIVSSAKNPALAEAHDRLLGRLARARYFALGAQGRWRESVLEHREILTALESRDGDTAQRLFVQHVGRTGEVVAAACASPRAVRAG